MVGSESLRGLGEGVVGVLVNSEYLVQLLGPSFFLVKLDCFFLPLEEHCERGIKKADSGL